jgi:hypothetical protein
MRRRESRLAAGTVSAFVITEEGLRPEAPPTESQPHEGEESGFAVTVGGTSGDREPDTRRRAGDGDRAPLSLAPGPDSPAGGVERDRDIRRRRLSEPRRRPTLPTLRWAAALVALALGAVGLALVEIPSHEARELASQPGREGVAREGSAPAAPRRSSERRADIAERRLAEAQAAEEEEPREAPSESAGVQTAVREETASAQPSAAGASRLERTESFGIEG